MKARKTTDPLTEFLRAQGRGVPACGIFTAETALLTTLYVSFFMELSTSRVHVAGTTSRPDSAWVTQQAEPVDHRTLRRRATSCSAEGPRDICSNEITNEMESTPAIC